MEKQYWYCIHAKEDMTQKLESDDRLRSFLTDHQVNLSKSVKVADDSMTLLDLVGKSFNGYRGERSMLFFRLKYNQYTRLPDTPKLYFGVYGIRGLHKFSGRPTSYTNCYLSEDTTLLGIDFFNYIFDSYYLSEKEARVESVKRLLDEKTKQDKKKEQRMDMQISEKDRILVCRIVERLWSCQLAKASTRFIICMDNEVIQSRSVELLKQVYMLLPQQLRLNMGFCTCSTLEDMKIFTEEYGLPVHIFTMSQEEAAKVKAEKDDFKNPIEIFNVENLEEMPYDAAKLKLLLELSEKITPSSDAKIAYAEKSILNSTIGNLVSFKNMQNILEIVNKEGFCWWERKNLDKIEDIWQLYMDQKEMMQIDVLRQEALNIFYTKLLPWKEYAAQIAAVVENDSYPNRQEILDFFSEELKFAKVIEAMQKMRGNLERKAAKREEEAVADINNRWKADVAQRQQRHEEALSEKDKECSRLRVEKEQSAQEYELRLQRQDERFAEERSAKEKELETALRHEADKMQKEIAAERESSSSEISRLNSEITKLQNTDVNRKLRELQNKLNASGEQKEQIRGQAEDAVQKKKLFQITTIVASSVAIIFLVVSIIFVMKGSGVGELTQANEKLESEKAILESERTGLQSTQAELESQVAVLKNENATLESEKEELANTSKKVKAESEKGEAASGKALVVYYTYVKGSTRAVAEEIQKQMGADIVELTTVEEYPSDYDAVVEKLQYDYANGVESQLSNSIDNLDEYDTIFLGYPVWISTMPKAIGTFLYKYDLAGKTIVPFCTYDSTSGGAGETEKELKKAQRDANFRDMLEVSDKHISDDTAESEKGTEGSESESTESEVETGESGNEPTEAESSAKEDASEFTEQVSEWLTGLGLPKKN